MPQFIGDTNDFKAFIATLADDASIEDAFKFYHFGTNTGTIGANGIQQYLINLKSDITTNATNISTVDDRVDATNATVAGLGSTYVRLISASASSNDILPQTNSVVPLRITAASGQSANLQEWRSNTPSIIARVASDGRMYAFDGTSTAEVVTTSGIHTLTNKTLNSASVVGGSISNATSITLTGTQTLNSYRVRNIIVSTSTPSTGVEGDIWLKY